MDFETLHRTKTVKTQTSKLQKSIRAGLEKSKEPNCDITNYYVTKKLDEDEGRKPGSKMINVPRLSCINNRCELHNI